MKKIILPLLLLVLVLTSCGGGSDDSGTSCGNVTNFTVTQNNENITVSLNSTATPLYYEVSVNSTPQTNVNPNNGFIRTMSTVTQTFNFFSDLNLQAGNTYLFYVRTACTDGSKSKWSAPVSLTASSFCFIPVELGITYSGQNVAFKWATNDTNSTSYKVEYGPQGFTQGAGTTVQVNNTLYSGMTMYAQTSYDFYVAAFCSNSQQWSSWAGPYTYFSETNQNACTLPLSLFTQLESQNTTTAYYSLHWTYNGETNFEYAVVVHNTTIGLSSIHPADTFGWPTVVLNRNYDYDFYMRSVCSDGSKTAWTGPVVIYP